MRGSVERDPPWVISEFNRVGVESSPAYAAVPRIADCTLRDGEQQPGVVFGREDRLALAQAIDSLGVYELELGTPATSEDDRDAIKELAGSGFQARLSALSRARRDDVAVVASTGVHGVRISLPISARQRAAKLKLSDDAYVALAVDICGYARELGLEVIFSPYDTTRAELGLLKRVLRALTEKEVVDRVRLVDTTGAASPEAIRHLVGVMRDASQAIPIEVHCHNDFGLAVANTLAGALAGAEFLSTTVTGIGERSGNAALEEVVMALKVLYGIDVGLNTERLCIVAAEVTRRSGVTLQPHKAIIGKNAFAHETGTVVAGLLHDHFTAETYDPSLVGQSRTIVVGKKSGRAAIEFKLREMGIPMADAGVSQTLIEVKARATSLGRALTDAEFEKVVHGVEAHVRSTAGSVDR